MFTRGTPAPAYTADHTARPSPTTPVRTPGPLVRGTGAPLMLPPPAVPLDPSDPATWPVPVQFT